MLKSKEILITKISGELEPFSEQKLRNSLNRVNAPPTTIENIVNQIIKNLKPGTETSAIYKQAFSLLRREQRHLAARFSLKNAIMALGPNGHPFEKFVGELLKSSGYTIEIGKIVEGVCVSHEVDVSAQKDNQHILVECKFHNQPETKSDVKIALYVQARFEDIQKKYSQQPGHAQKYHEIWLVTNTKLTMDAIRYASCVGLKAIGWNHPVNWSLQNLIEASGLHPLTCLTTLTIDQKRQLVAQGLVLCKELNSKILQSLALSNDKINSVMSEISVLCQTH